MAPPTAAPVMLFPFEPESSPESKQVSRPDPPLHARLEEEVLTMGGFV